MFYFVNTRLAINKKIIYTVYSGYIQVSITPACAFTFIKIQHFKCIVMSLFGGREPIAKSKIV